MELLNDWFKANQLSLNMSKTVAMLLWDEKKNVQITLDGKTIPLVETTKFLGITLDCNLLWNPHINNLYNKLQANKHLLSMSSKSTDNSKLKAAILCTYLQPFSLWLRSMGYHGK